MSYQPREIPMSNKILYGSAILFACIIVLSNYLVGFRILDTHITYGALSYPFSFLIMDILSEKFNRKDVMRALRIGLLLTFLPSLFIATTPTIAIASVSAFFISQFLDVVVFYRLKQKYPSFWWLRNGVSAGIAQLVDTFIFFHVAFFFTMPYYDVFMLFISDYGIKLLVNLLDIPVFYLIAIKTYKKFQFFSK
ncbi:hypothetical protein CQA53_07250 [Helicobacter didelphidarum]|uniref:Probable queuosine precursor transporter n=1 Tax=Helicobacter didelphidarum TaxID=2040648 RepID=A0A3D8IJV4_9HELI|nr:queuosine precursor transporter [Helicobacter didelphidarum]RDU64944.1 hypothetical protein CQA53_07250 [Helicobacter didelphidarum]